MSKEKFGEQYIEFLLGTLEEEPRLELEEHVTQCPECRQNLYELRETLHSLPQFVNSKLNHWERSRPEFSLYFTNSARLWSPIFRHE